MWEPLIRLNMARENDWIYNRDGTKCHSDLFCSVIDKINLALQQAVIQYQIIQKDYNEFDVYLVIDEEEEMDMVQRLFLENYEKYQENSGSFIDRCYGSYHDSMRGRLFG